MSKRWTDKLVKELEQKRPGSVRNYSDPAQKNSKNPQKDSTKGKKNFIPKQRQPELREMISWLSALKISFELEYRFHPTRKWRFDIAIPSAMVAVEYEGIFSDTSRHTTVAGYTEDAQKYNAAQILGWKVLRYTSKNYKRFLPDITSVLNIPTI